MRRRNHALYDTLLGGRFRTQRPPRGSVVCSISFGLLAKDGGQRRRIVSALAANGIETRIFSAGNLGLHPFWTRRYKAPRFPMADRIHHHGFFLPNSPSLGEADVREIAGVVLGAA